MNRIGIVTASRSIFIFGTMLGIATPASADPLILNCTLIGPRGGATDLLRIDAAAHTATWKNETGKIQLEKENILFLGWHVFDVASYDKGTGNFDYSFKAADGTRRYTQARTCRKA